MTRRRQPPRYTSAQIAGVIRYAERRWFGTRLRARLDDGDRGVWHDRYVARIAAAFVTGRLRNVKMIPDPVFVPVARRTP